MMIARVTRVLKSFLPNQWLLMTIAVRLTGAGMAYVAFRLTLGVVPQLLSSLLHFMFQTALFMTLWTTISHAEGVFIGHVVKVIERTTEWARRIAYGERRRQSSVGRGNGQALPESAPAAPETSRPTLPI